MMGDNMAAKNNKKPTSTRKRDPNLAKIISEIKEDEERERSKKVKETKKVNEEIEVIEDVPKKEVVKEEKEVKEVKKKETKEIKQTKMVQEEVPKNKKRLVITFSIFAIISFILLIVFKLPHKEYFKDIDNLVTLGVLLFTTLVMIILGIKNNNKKLNKFLIIVLLLLTGYNTFNILVDRNIIKLHNQDNYVPNFYNTSITDVYSWNKEKNILINEKYEFSDLIPIYNVISQDVSPNTPIKDVSVINLIVSNGPNYDLETVVPSFIGWEYDTVIDYLEKNFLNNVDISFEKSNNKENTVISQIGSGSRKRNDLIKLVFAISEIKETEIIDLTGYSLIKAIGWLSQHGFKYEIVYENSEEMNKDYVISNSDVGETKDPLTDTIKLTVSKGKIIKVPNIESMSQADINKWIMDNNLKVTYIEKYDEEVSLGDVIDSSVKDGDIIEAGSKVEVVISKGKLEMPKIESIDTFKIWASENKINYQVNYDFSDTVKSGDILKCSHNTGDAIKENDTVIITISKGKSISVPNFIGTSQSNAKSKCSSLGLSCTIRDGDYSDKYQNGVILKQSQSAGAKVSSGSNVTLYVSKGPQPKVNVPSFVGQTKSTIQSKCNSLGIKCNFTYQSNFSSTAKDTCVSQSKTGTVVKGTTITITLSKGPAKTYTFEIYANQYLVGGNPEQTKAKLQAKLSQYKGVNFVYKFEKGNSGIGYLSKNSQIKVGSNTVTEGKTYNVIIISN